jgi:hypothetical protein
MCRFASCGVVVRDIAGVSQRRVDRGSRNADPDS